MVLAPGKFPRLRTPHSHDTTDCRVFSEVTNINNQNVSLAHEQL